MKSYYQDEACTIYHGDCREILPQLPKVDLVLTDPPYGMNYQSNMRVATQRFETIAGDEDINTEWIPLVKGKLIVCFCRWNLMDRWREEIDRTLSVRGCIIWHKACGFMGDLERSFGLDYEMILYATDDAWKIPGKRHGSVWKCQIDPPSSYQHPTQKPVGIMTMCIDRFGGTTILDPFMGSGTTLVAAKQLQRKAIGIELEEKYCEIAAERLRQGVLELF